MTLQINNGDTVLVRLTVRDGAPMSGDRVLFRDEKDDGCVFGVARDDIVSVEAKPLKVGDQVTIGTIIAIHNNEAWVDRGADGCATYDLYNLTRVPAPALRTNRDVLRVTYPDQFRRICEIANEQGVTYKLDEPMTRDSVGTVLSYVMCFSDTREGYEHWARLAYAHGWMS